MSLGGSMQAVLARFLRLADIVPEGCWIWRGNISHKGYGQIKIGRKTIRAAQWACRFTWGLAGKREPDHLCRVRACVNPWHLEPVTRQTNVRRGDSPAGINARKVRCIHGHSLADAYVVMSRGFPTRRCRTCAAIEAQRRREYHRAYLRAWRSRRAHAV
jgi:hypothetical protein